MKITQLLGGLVQAVIPKRWRRRDHWPFPSVSVRRGGIRYQLPDEPTLAPGHRMYGGTDTWHRTTTVDVETDQDGNVVAVWFRCTMLPFSHRVVNADRTREMRHAYEAGAAVPLVAVELDDTAVPTR